MALTALKRRTDDTTADDRPADLIAIEAQVADLKAKRADLVEQQRQADPDDVAEVNHLAEAVAALNAEMLPIRGKLRALREAHAAAAARAARPVTRIDRIAAMTPRSDRHELAEDRLASLRSERARVDAKLKAISAGQPLDGETVRDARRRIDAEKIALARPLQTSRNELQRLIDQHLPDVRAMRRAHAAEIERALSDETQRAAAAIVEALRVIDAEQTTLREIIEKVNRASADYMPGVPGVEVRALRALAERLAR